MRGLIALVLLAACGNPLPDEKGGWQHEVYRNMSVPIASKAVFEPAKYLGTWHEVARFPVPFERGCAQATATYEMRDDGDILMQNVCRDPDGMVLSEVMATAKIVGPGRLTLSYSPVPTDRSDYWVLWVDEGYRTAVVGAPNGQSGWILNRDPKIPADRLNAAREVLDFNGYDVTKLMEVPQ